MYFAEPCIDGKTCVHCRLQAGNSSLRVRGIDFGKFDGRQFHY